MDEYKASNLDLDGEVNLIAAANQIIRALGSKKKLTDDEKKILCDLGLQLSALTMGAEKEEEVKEEDGGNEMEERLNAIQKTILKWETDESMIWSSGVEESSEYLNAADEARKLTEELESLCVNGDNSKSDLLRMAHNVLQMSMARLEEEFKYLLIQNKQFYEPEHMSFRSSEEDIVESGSVISFGDESVEESLHRDSVGRVSEELIIDLVHPDVLDDLKCIASLMYSSNYGHECSQAYIAVRRDALDECLHILEMEKLSIEDVLRLEWGNLNSKIKRWIRAMRTFVRVYLASEKWLCEQVFGELGIVNLVEASKASMLQLLNFGDAVCIGPHKPEKLFPILDMYEVIADLLPDLDSLYSDEAGYCVRAECCEVQRRLGDSARVAFLEFENAIATSTSTVPFAGGGIHHLTKYVMNYIKILTDYREILNFLLQDQTREDVVAFPSPDTTVSIDEENSIEGSYDASPMAIHFRSIVSILESNLEEKAKLYRDAALHHIFLMNNLRYMAQKVKNSELRNILGDWWIRKCNGKFQHHAMNYERSSWSAILLLLKEEGNSSHSAERTPLRDRFRSFYLAFEEVYRTQTAWIIPDDQLREDLRISISLKVIQAYRTFLGRHVNQVSERHIKYSADDLQNYLLDLFEGSPRSMHNPYRR